MKEAISRLALVVLKPAAGRGECERERLAEWSEGSPWGQKIGLQEESLGVLGGLVCRWGDGANPPLATSSDQNVRVLLDGSLFNKEELRGRALGVQGEGVGGSESSLLLRLYLGEGASFVAEANGWFAAVVVDCRLKRVYVATDRFGMHPLYYCETERGLFVASEARTVLKLAGLRTELSLAGLADYLAYNGVLNGRTLFRDVYRMPAAALWRFDGQAWDRGQHFDFRTLVGSSSEGVALKGEADAEEVFARVVPRYLSPREEVAFSVTGGWDTRLIASFMDGSSPRSYTYGMNPRSPDAVLGRRVAETIGSEHTFFSITEDFFRKFGELAEEAMWSSDGMSDIVNADIPFVFDQFGPEVKRLLTGKYGTQMRAEALPAMFRQGLGYVFESVDPDLREGLKQMAGASLQESLARVDYGVGRCQRDLLFILLEECRRIWGGNLAIERTRVSPCTPFLDNEVVGLWFALPEGLRQGSGLRKTLVSRRRPDLAVVPTDRGDLAMAGGVSSRLSAWRYRVLGKLNMVANARRVPPKLRVDRLPFAKMGRTQYRRWLREELSGFVREVLLDPDALRRGVFTRAAIERAVSEHLGRKVDRSNELRKMLSLELTHRIFFDGQA